MAMTMSNNFDVRMVNLYQLGIFAMVSKIVQMEVMRITVVIVYETNTKASRYSRKLLSVIITLCFQNTCGKGKFRCESGDCIPIVPSRCNGLRDCSDGSDEFHCDIQSS